jgi:catechol 2,3-dioxygenase-like lactoylglutathione lyase family enzyme
VPALPVRDVRAAVAFYVDRLGFRPVHTGDDFAIVRRDDAEIHLWAAADEGWRERAPDREPAVRSGAESFLAGTASCRIPVRAVDALHTEMRAAGVLHAATPEVVATFFGTREFTVVDLDGNALAFHTDPPEP